MTLQEFEFNLVQVDSVIANSRHKFKLWEHQLAYENLISLHNEVKARYKTFDILKLRACSDKILDKIYLGIESLHYNKWSEVPSHLTKCLEVALNDWINESEEFSIVFSNSNNSLQDFLARRYLHSDINDTNLLCSALKLGAKYEHKLIQIYQPGFFNNEFLSCIPTYHELGHFVESYYSIPYHIAYSEFPFEYEIGGKKYNNDSKADLIFCYMREHFCDLFAAQYLGSCMSEYLNYLIEGHSYSWIHPSTIRRIEVIETFLAGTGSGENMKIVDKLLETTKIQTKRSGLEQELKDRTRTLSIDPFEKDKPQKLNNPNEVHTLFKEGWTSFIDTHSSLFGKFPNHISRNKRINYLVKNSIDLTLPAHH